MVALLLCKSILWVFLGGITINGNAPVLSVSTKIVHLTVVTE